MNKIKPSSEQIDIFKYVKYEKGNALIDAVAGSGKTSTLVKCLDLVPDNERALFLAFNKHTAEEIEHRVKRRNIEIMTLHKFGLKSLHYNFNGLTIDNKKLIPWIEKMLSDDDKKNEILINKIYQLINLVRQNMLQDTELYFELCSKHQLDLEERYFPLINQIIKIGQFQKDIIDYEDMIWIPATQKIKMLRYKWVLVDECQDLNKSQQALILKALDNRDGRLLAVGDPYQAIYGFNGSDTESFNFFKNLENTKIFPLSTCYRCAKEIVKEAQKIVPHIIYNEEKENGEVLYYSNIEDIEDESWIICRNQLPLIKIFYKLKMLGKNPIFHGYDLSKDLKNEINKAIGNDLKEKIDYLVDKLKFKKIKEENCNSVWEEKIQILEFLYVSKKSLDIYSFLKEIDKLFLNENSLNTIHLSTIHKTKGMEFDIVYILDKNLFNSKTKQKWEYLQEKNLEYVAITRAKKKLAYLKSF